MTAPDWLNHALHAHLASRPTRIGDIPVSADFQERCRDAALAALDVLKMRRQLASSGNVPGSLLDLFSLLATRASVGLERVFQTFGIRSTEPLNETSARGLARLSCQIGLSHAESALRLRWGFAKCLVPNLIPDWSADLVPVRARQTDSNSSTTKSPNHDEALQRCESRYSVEQRHELRAALAAFSTVFESATN